jgi:hypothetical protein
MSTTVPTDRQERIRAYAEELKIALQRDALDYAAKWQKDSGNRATIQDGYILKVGATRAAANNLLAALHVAGLDQ